MYKTSLVKTNTMLDRTIPDSVTIASNTQLTVYSGELLPMFWYKDLTINVGATLTASTTSRGLIIAVKGTLTLNGVISMTAKGFGFATLPNTRYLNLYALLDGKMVMGVQPCNCVGEVSSNTKPTIYTSDKHIFTIDNSITTAAAIGSHGIDGNKIGLCGGGGASLMGAGYDGRVGGMGYMFSGGSGAGGSRYGAGDIASWAGYAPVNYGLNGGYTYNTNSATAYCGGAGNPGIAYAQTGTGGLLIVVANEIKGSGNLESKGMQGGYDPGGGVYAGSGSGGGAIIVRYLSSSTLVSSTQIVTTGGLGYAGQGKNGGKGHVSYECFF